jgi:hypothetical protein
MKEIRKKTSIGIENNSEADCFKDLKLSGNGMV